MQQIANAMGRKDSRPISTYVSIGMRAWHV